MSAFWLQSSWLINSLFLFGMTLIHFGLAVPSRWLVQLWHPVHFTFCWWSVWIKNCCINPEALILWLIQSCPYIADNSLPFQVCTFTPTDFIACTVSLAIYSATVSLHQSHHKLLLYANVFSLFTAGWIILITLKSIGSGHELLVTVPIAVVAWLLKAQGVLGKR